MSQTDSRCIGEHAFFVAEVCGVELEGTLVVVQVCRQCGKVVFTEQKVASPGTPLRLLREEKEK